MAISADWTRQRHPALWSDLPATEAGVVGFFDPSADLQKRMLSWGYPPGALDLADLARFAAGLAQAEATAWQDRRFHVATRAYAERRFLVGDRVLHWAVPWLEAVGRCHPDRRELARTSTVELLSIADDLRPAPALSGSEGLVVPGFDGFGPLEPDVPIRDFVLSLWSGSLLLTADISRIRHSNLADRAIDRSWFADRSTRAGLVSHYLAATRRWDLLATEYPGTAQMWRDLSHRAAATARRLTA
ncbi:MAG: hypothetical protein OEO77_13390 [Acidimicrobiia bacterium]|nr:hypothetical protein [Acidimicrobiia bacterium]